MTLGIDPQQLAQAALELLRNHWTAAAAPLANAALTDAGKSLFALLKGKFTSKAAAGALEEAAGNPASAVKARALAVQIEGAIEEDPQFAEALRALLRPAVVQSASQSGEKNVSTQTAGDSNVTSIKVS